MIYRQFIDLGLILRTLIDSKYVDVNAQTPGNRIKAIWLFSIPGSEKIAKSLQLETKALTTSSEPHGTQQDVPQGRSKQLATTYK